MWQVREAQGVHWLLRLRVLGDAGETALLSVLNLTLGLMVSMGRCYAKECCNGACVCIWPI